MAGQADSDMTFPHRSEQFPCASRPAQRQAARNRERSYPYRFPRDRRPLGGKFSVDENGRRLLRYFYLARRLAHGLGSWTLSIPDFEVMVETGRHIFWHMDAAYALRRRLNELEMSIKAVDGYRNEDLDLFVDEILCAKDPAELLVGVHLVAGNAMQTAFAHHIDDTDTVTDAPTIRLLKRVMLDYEPMLEWAEAAVEAYIEGGIDEARLNSWRWRLQRLLASIGGLSGADEKSEPPTPLRCEETPYERGTQPLRDPRFEAFTHTGDYDTADEEPRFDPKTYDSLRLRFVRQQRDEVDAIEAFGTCLWDIRFKDFMAEYYLARITWDEARHTEIGHKTMQAMGYDPFELPNRLISSPCRGEMTEDDSAFAMAEINLFGEVGVLKTINDLVDKARDTEDVLLAHISDVIRADERTHVRNGQYVISKMTELGPQDLELRTREMFTECMINLGAIDRLDDVFTVEPLSREEIERLIGE